MSEFEFIIDKRANFARFIEIISEEERFGGKILKEFFAKKLEGLTQKELDSASAARTYFQKKRRNGFIWREYSEKQPNDENDRALINLAKNGLEERFNNIFNNEIPKLNLWKEKLSEFIETQKGKEIIQKINTFFDFSPQKITVLLLISGNKKVFRARAFPPAKNILLLEVSNESIENIKNGFLALIHEYAHNAMNTSEQIAERINTETEEIKKYNFPIPKEWNEKSILEESMVVAITGPRLTSALGYHIYGENSKEVEKDIVTQEEFERGRAMRFIIRVVAMRISKFSYTYIESDKAIDDAFYKELTKTWIQTLQEIDKFDKKNAA